MDVGEGGKGVQTTTDQPVRGLRNLPIVTGGVEIRRVACSLSSRSNGGARKGAVSATWLSGSPPSQL